MWSDSWSYLDNVATTAVRWRVSLEMARYWRGRFANPSSTHGPGLVARGSIEMARERVAAVLCCDSGEIVFTGSGTEANNLALRGIAAARRQQGRHLVTSQIEHSSVLETCAALEREGFEITRIGVDRQGRFRLDELAAALRPDTVLVSLGYANNEIGTVQDVRRIATLVRGGDAAGSTPALHLDAVQALPYFALDPTQLDVDLMSFSGHKLGGPKGVGVLHVRRGLTLAPVITGGGQELGLRSGTENVAAIVGMSRAVLLNDREKPATVRRLAALRDRLVERVLASTGGVVLTGHARERTPNHASFCFRDVDGKALVRAFAQRRIAVSSGSACASAHSGPSPVLLACGIAEDYVRGSLRVTLGRSTRGRDIERFLAALPGVLRQVRAADAGGGRVGGPSFISQLELRARLLASAPLQILDLRYSRYPRRSIPGAIRVPPWRFGTAVRRLDPAAETVLVCYHGDVISPQAHAELLRRGFTNVRVLRGGMFGYEPQPETSN